MRTGTKFLRRDPAEVQPWAETCGSIRCLIEEADEAAAEIQIVEIQEAKLHYHKQTDEFYYNGFKKETTMKQQTGRRMFLRHGLMIGAGASAGLLLPAAVREFTPQTALAQEEGSAGNAEARLRELEIELPPPPTPVAVYVPAVRVGNTLYASGHGPRRLDGTLVQGKVGKDLTLEQGYDAARIVGLNILSSVRNALGSLDKVVRLVKVLGMVNCTPEFTQQPQVINGFSELMVQVFGEDAGKGARSAVGMGALPSNIAVEIEAIYEVRG